MLRAVCISVLLVGSVLPLSAHAQLQFSAGLGMRQAQMTELDTRGQTLVTERGWLPGVRLRGEYRLEHWCFGISGDLYGGDLDYDGRLQGGAPFNTDSGTRQSRLGFDLARRLNARTRLLAAVEWDLWKRRIKGHSGTLGMDERYDSWHLLGGAEFDLLQGTAASLSARTMLIVSSPEKMRVQFDTGVFDEARLSTKAAGGARLALAFVPANLPALTVGVQFDWLRVPRSAGAVLRQGGNAVGTVTQPEHVRRAIDLYVSYRF